MQEKFYFEFLNTMPKIKRINKVQVNNQVKQKWIDYNKQKYEAEQAEKARLEAEEAERERLEQEAKD